MLESQKLLEIIELQESESALWNDFVAKSAQGTFFHSAQWTGIISDVFGRPYKLLLCLKNNQPVGGIAFIYHKKMVWQLITPTPLFPFNSPIFYSAENEKSHKTIFNHLKITEKFESYLNQHYTYWVLDTSSNNQDMRAYQWRGAAVEPRYSYVVDLKNENNLIDIFNQSLRKKLKLAEQQNYRMQESNDPECLIGLFKKSYIRHGMSPLISEVRLRSLLNKTLQLPQIKLYHAQKDGETRAARLILADKHTGYDLLAGSSDPEGIASAFLVAQILRGLIPVLKSFDFMGADHPQIEQFKRGFGGKLTQSFRITNRIRPPLSWVVSSYQRYLSRERKL